MRRSALLALAALISLALSSTSLFAQASGTGGSTGSGSAGTYTRLLPTVGMQSITINKGDTLVLSMADYETLTIHPGFKVTSIDVSHRPVMSAITSADRWVTEQVDMESGMWFVRDDHGCLRTSPLPDDPTPPLRLVVPGTHGRDYYLSNALCTGGVREVMIVAQ
jgi:hypothetical protein